MKLRSAEWAAAFRDALNANAAYRAAARGWSGELLFLIRAPAEGTSGLRVELADGECRSAEYLPIAAGAAAELSFEGDLATWSALLGGRIDPVAAVLRGALQVRGSLAKLLRFTRAATLLVQTAQALGGEL